MGWDDGDDEFHRVEFDRGPEKRLPMVLLLDTSKSMRVVPKDDDTAEASIEQLNDALADWAREMKTDRITRERLEIAIVTFGKDGVNLHPEGDDLFVPAALFDPPRFSAGGTTPMIEAIHQAEEIVATRNSQLDAMGRTRFRPMIAMISDGYPTNEQGNVKEEADWEADAAAFKRAQSDEPGGKRYVFCAFGTENADLPTLKKLTDGKAKRISETEFLDILVFLSASASAADPIAAIYELFQTEPDPDVS